jgi:hypothetical protein
LLTSIKWRRHHTITIPRLEKLNRNRVTIPLPRLRWLC